MIGFSEPISACPKIYRGYPCNGSRPKNRRQKSWKLRFGKYGLESYNEYVKNILDQSEQLALLKLNELPRGTFEGEYFLDGDGDDENPISEKLRVHMKVEIKRDEFIIHMATAEPGDESHEQSAL